MKAKTKTFDEWAELWLVDYGITMVYPTGFYCQDEAYDQKSYTHEEFRERLMKSTLQVVDSAKASRSGVFPWLVNTGLFNKALAIAREDHLHQNDKIGMPYIYHPLRVAMAVLMQGHPEEVVAAAVLHDVMEDCGETSATLAQKGMPASVVQMVGIVSRWKGEPYMDYIRRVKFSENRGAIAIKLADLHDNSLPIRNQLLDPKVSKGLLARYRKAEKELTGRDHDEG